MVPADFRNEQISNCGLQMGVRCFGQEQALSTYSKFKILLKHIIVPMEAKTKTNVIIGF